MSFKEVVSYQRAVAHTAPCELAGQCADPRYFFFVQPAQGMRCGVNLTVNVGEE